jgi:Reverse transcriptase (RNA-dependent DNA polymerase)
VFLQLDLSSVSNTLDTSTLLRRIRFTYGISGPALNWVSWYLMSRSQSVHVGQKQSSSIVCEYGVPQGSVLKPLLFTQHISLLAKVISSFRVNHAQFADDTQLYITLKDENSTTRLSEYFRAVQHWLDLNGLSMNPDKTETIVISTIARKRMEGLVNTVDLGCVSVSPKSSVRSPGVTTRCRSMNM